MKSHHCPNKLGSVPLNVMRIQTIFWAAACCPLCKQRDGQVLLPALPNRACRAVCSELVPSLSLVLSAPEGLFLWSQWSIRPFEIRYTYLGTIVRNPKWVACMMPSGRQQMLDFILAEIHLHTALWRSLLLGDAMLLLLSQLCTTTHHNYLCREHHFLLPPQNTLSSRKVGHAC